MLPSRRRARRVGSRLPAAVAAALLAGAADARAEDVGRYRVRGTLMGSALYDDNVYFDTDPDSGTALRLHPGVDGLFRASPTLSVEGAYGFDADVYPDQPELNSLFASQLATASARYRVDARTSLSLGAVYSQSNTSGDLVAGAGLDFGRVRGTSWGMSAGGTRQVSRAGTLGLDYARQTVAYEDTPDSLVQSLTLNWSQRVAARTGLSLSGGARFVDGATSAEGSAMLHRDIERGTLVLAYARSRYPAPGQAVDVESVTATGVFTLSRAWQVSASPGYYRNRLEDEQQTHSWRLALSASCQVRPGLSARATYQYVRQNALIAGTLGLQQGPWISRNVFAVSFTASTSRPREQRVQPGVGPLRPASPAVPAPLGRSDR
jgi:hypothetical protein